MNNKILFLYGLWICYSVPALADSPPVPVNPVQAALAEARASVEEGDTDAAVARLQRLAAAGFTGVALIEADEVLNALAGHAAYDQLIAEMRVAAYPCEHDPSFREFDFWVGTWDVHLENGSYAGHNRIEPAEHGCVLIERWNGASGSTGLSINYLDKKDGQWVQVWTDASGSQIDIRGGMTEEGMLLEGSIHYVSSGTTAGFRGLWTPLPDGRVRQSFEQASPDDKTWSPWFTGYYTRVAEQ